MWSFCKVCFAAPAKRKAQRTAATPYPKPGYSTDFRPQVLKAWSAAVSQTAFVRLPPHRLLPEPGPNPTLHWTLKVPIYRVRQRDQNCEICHLVSRLQKEILREPSITEYNGNQQHQRKMDKVCGIRNIPNPSKTRKEIPHPNLKQSQCNQTGRKQTILGK